MSSIKNITKSITDTLKSSDLKGLTAEYGEVFLDSFLADGIAKDIPVLNSIVAAFKTSGTVKDMLFAKKIVYFLTQINDVPVEQREIVISEIDESKKYRIKVGEKLLYILDKLDDHEKSEIVGYLYSLFLKREIGYDDLLRCALVVDKCMVEDLKWFVLEDVHNYDLRYSSNLMSAGLLEFQPLNLKIIKSNNSNSGNTGFDIDNKEFKLKISPPGNILRQFLVEYMIRQYVDLKYNEWDFEQLNSYIEKIKTEFSETEHYQKINFIYKMVVIGITNNWIITDSEYNNLCSTLIININYRHINIMQTEIEKYNRECIKSSNEFNNNRWLNFCKYFKMQYAQNLVRNGGGLDFYDFY